MSLGGCEGSVNCTVTKPEIPWLFTGSILTSDESLGTVGIPIRCVSRYPLHLSIDFNNLIIVIMPGIFRVFRATPDNLMIPISTKSTIDPGMPLSDLSCGVAVASEYLRPKRTLLRVVNASGVHAFHPHRLYTELMSASEHRCTRRHTPSPHVGMGKPNTLCSQSINIRRVNPRIGLRVTADGSMRLIVCEDKENIGAVSSRSQLSSYQNAKALDKNESFQPFPPKPCTPKR